MPRPTVVNTKRQPIPALNLEEMKFWLRIMEEHALFIKAGLPCENTALINQADTFQQEFAALRVRVERVQAEKKFAELVADTQTVVEDFYRYKRRLLHLVLTCQIGGCNFALFLDHLSREAEYFLRLLSKLGSGQQPYQVAAAREAEFWIRLMEDHTEFISHRLDPSERTLLATAEGFSDEFDGLYLQSRDFVSMLRGEPDEVPSFRRFLQDVRVSTMRLRDFERAAEALIAECKVVGLIPALLADHVRREADHFLLILAILEKGTYVPVDDVGDLEFIQDEIASAPVAVKNFVAEDCEEEEVNCVEPLLPLIGKLPLDNTIDYDDDDKEDCDDDCADDYSDREPEEAPPPPPPTKPSKYKWSGKWPRPLGGTSK